jgi:hypothetical protein
MAEEKLLCAYCGEDVVGEPIRRGSQVFCCEACAFEGARSVDCAGRTDVSQASLVEEMEFRENPPES